MENVKRVEGLEGVRTKYQVTNPALISLISTFTAPMIAIGVLDREDVPWLLPVMMLFMAAGIGAVLAVALRKAPLELEPRSILFYKKIYKATELDRVELNRRMYSFSLYYKGRRFPISGQVPKLDLQELEQALQVWSQANAVRLTVK
ncbi:MAG TPA: hypothetical protein VFV52_02695 [Bacilli bacterium]|nr:hypothetical protein [Bacilli bacterium]